MSEALQNGLHFVAVMVVWMAAPAIAQRISSPEITSPIAPFDPDEMQPSASADARLELPTPSTAPVDTPPMFDASTPAGLARVLSDVIYECIPRDYEKKKNWERKKSVTLGFRTEGSGLDLRIRRRKKELKHGTWQQYRIDMIEPDKNLDVQIKNLRSLNAGQLAFTLSIVSQLEGWAQARIYNRGIHLITLSVEGSTSLRMNIDCRVSLHLTPSAFLTGLEVVPLVTDAQVELDDFTLSRVSKLHGPLVRELGKGLRRFVEDELDGSKSVAKLNRAIEKKRHRLRISPDAFLTFSQ